MKEMIFKFFRSKAKMVLTLFLFLSVFVLSSNSASAQFISSSEFATVYANELQSDALNWEIQAKLGASKQALNNILLKRDALITVAGYVKHGKTPQEAYNLLFASSQNQFSAQSNEKFRQLGQGSWLQTYVYGVLTQ